jgi:hypothetical protein
MTLTMITTAVEVMEALGGNVGVGRLTGGKPSAVSNWKTFGKFPANQYVVMIEALRERGFDAPPSLWGMK